MNNEINLDLLPPNKKLFLISLVNNENQCCVPYKQFDCFLQQLIDCSCLLEDNSLPERTRLWPTQKLEKACAKWDRQDLQRQIDNTTPRNLVGGVNFGYA